MTSPSLVLLEDHIIPLCTAQTQAVPIATPRELLIQTDEEEDEELDKAQTFQGVEPRGRQGNKRTLWRDRLKPPVTRLQIFI